MTNTRITDPEIMERRYPVILRKFSLRPNSGGKGQHKGGDGVVRDLEFRRPVQCSILSERRVYQPYGMHGGEPAALGLNLWVSKDQHGRERVVNMGGKNTVPMKAGGESRASPVVPSADNISWPDRVVILTPGGGGYGPVSKETALKTRKETVFIGNGTFAERISMQQSN